MPRSFSTELMISRTTRRRRRPSVLPALFGASVSIMPLTRAITSASGEAPLTTRGTGSHSCDIRNPVPMELRSPVPVVGTTRWWFREIGLTVVYRAEVAQQKVDGSSRSVL
jgi:hypothetical protein